MRLGGSRSICAIGSGKSVSPTSVDETTAYGSFGSQFVRKLGRHQTRSGNGLARAVPPRQGLGREVVRDQLTRDRSRLGRIKLVPFRQRRDVAHVAIFECVRVLDAE